MNIPRINILGPKLKERLRQYYYLTRLDRPIGIFLLLWPMLWGLWIASEGKPDLLVLFVFVMGVVLMRSAGCVINDYADRKIDPHVERTRQRPIAAGRVKPKEALLVFVVLCLIAFVSSSIFLIGIMIFLRTISPPCSFFSNLRFIRCNNA